MARIAASPSVSARMPNATLISEVVSTGNFSYDAATSWGEGYPMIGDVFAFLDPVFSSGVLLAMTAAERGAAVADAWLDNPARGRRLAKRMERDLRHAMGRIAWLIYRINTPALRLLFLAPRNTLGMRDGLVVCLPAICAAVGGCWCQPGIQVDLPRGVAGVAARLANRPARRPSTAAQ